MRYKKEIGYGLYILAIILLSIHIYQMGADIENRFFDIAGWVALIVASLYGMWIAKDKKTSDQEKK